MPPIIPGQAAPAAPSPASPSSALLGQNKPPGQPPFGSSPATGATPNKGSEAQGFAMLSLGLRQLEKAIPLFGMTSDVGRDLAQAVLKLAKHIPAGSVSPAAEGNQLDRLRMQQAQLGPQLQQLRAAGAQPGGAGGAGASPGGGAAAA